MQEVKDLKRDVVLQTQGFLLFHTLHTHTVSMVRPRPTVAKVAMTTSHQNGNYN